MTNLPGTPVSRSAFLAAAAGLVLAACGSDSVAGSTANGASSDTRPPSPSSTLAPAAQPAGPGAASVIPAALIGATTINGDPFDANLLAGRPTVAWFWAPWCVICRGEAPDVADIAARYAGKVNFVGIAGRGEAPAMRDFVSETGTGGITHLDDSSGDIWASYEIYAQPAYAFITDDGRLETYVGSLGGDGLAVIIDKLIDA
ncbi:MAG: redoxin family protein [Ilumatobacteraceae bacterium]